MRWCWRPAGSYPLGGDPAAPDHGRHRGLLRRRREVPRQPGGHPLGRSLLGTEDTIDDISAKDCRKFHEQVFVPNNTVLVEAGNETDEAYDPAAEAARPDPALLIPSRFRPYFLREVKLQAAAGL